MSKKVMSVYGNIVKQLQAIASERGNEGGQECGCGCGQLVQGIFAQGHDMKLKSRLKGEVS